MINKFSPDMCAIGGFMARNAAGPIAFMVAACRRMSSGDICDIRSAPCRSCELLSEGVEDEDDDTAADALLVGISLGSFDLATSSAIFAGSLHMVDPMTFRTWSRSSCLSMPDHSDEISPRFLLLLLSSSSPSLLILV